MLGPPAELPSPLSSPHQPAWPLSPLTQAGSFLPVLGWKGSGWIGNWPKRHWPVEWLFKVNKNNSVPQSHQPHLKYWIVTCASGYPVG